VYSSTYPRADPFIDDHWSSCHLDSLKEELPKPVRNFIEIVAHQDHSSAGDSMHEPP